jgi:hypothetical protein
VYLLCPYSVCYSFFFFFHYLHLFFFGVRIRNRVLALSALWKNSVRATRFVQLSRLVWNCKRIKSGYDVLGVCEKLLIFRSFCINNCDLRNFELKRVEFWYSGIKIVIFWNFWRQNSNEPIFLCQKFRNPVYFCVKILEIVFFE